MAIHTVKEFMSEQPVALKATDTVASAMKLNQTSTFRHYPVVNEAGRVVGILSDRNLRNVESTLEVLQRSFENPADRLKVEDVMKKEVVSVFPDSDLAEAAQIIIDMKVGALPVVENQRLVGILSYVDVFDAFARLEARHAI